MLCSQMTSRKVGVSALKPFFAKIYRTEIFHKTSFTMMIRMLVRYLNSGNMSDSDPCVIRFLKATEIQTGIWVTIHNLDYLKSGIFTIQTVCYSDESTFWVFGI